LPSAFSKQENLKKCEGVSTRISKPWKYKWLAPKDSKYHKKTSLFKGPPTSFERSSTLNEREQKRSQNNNKSKSFWPNGQNSKQCQWFGVITK